MTADERLNQLEPLVSEGLAVLDRHTAQLRQLQNSVGQLITTATQHSDTLSFLLREQLAMKSDIVEMKSDIVEMKSDIVEMKSDIAEMKNGITGMQGDIAELKGDITGMQGDIAGLKTHQVTMDGKLDQILNLLQKPSA